MSEMLEIYLPDHSTPLILRLLPGQTVDLSYGQSSYRIHRAEDGSYNRLVSEYNEKVSLSAYRLRLPS